MKNKRLVTATITGCVLGIFCILGMGVRMGFEGNYIFLASAWFNRLVMGIVIGISGRIVFSNRYNTIIRGASFGLIISFAWYLSTGLRDPLGFSVGIIYGIIIDYFATRVEKK